MNYFFISLLEKVRRLIITKQEEFQKLTSDKPKTFNNFSIYCLLY